MIAKIEAIFHKYSKWIESIFLIAVSVAVLVEIVSISKTISPSQLAVQFGDIPVWKIGAIIIAGLVAVSPMIGYDVLLNKSLGNKMTKAYLFESSWIINSINNLAGFGGLVSVGLRTEFYGKKVESKNFAATLTRLFMFIMSGLSLFSIVALIMVWTGYANAYVSQYWIWLLGGSLYIPFVWVTSTINKTVITTRFKMQVTGISILEWTGVIGLFLFIGWMIGMPLPMDQVMPIFVAAMIIGIVSMIPGSIGSFDVIMIIGLSDLGLPREAAVAWLLLYRIAYYFVPFAFGLILLIKNFGASFNERYNEVPNQIVMTVGHRIVSALLYFSGVMMILYATIPDAFDRWHWLHLLNPWSANLISEFPSIILGFLLLLVARGIASQVKRALYPALIVLFLTSCYMYTREVSLWSVAFTLLLMILVWLIRARLFREQFIYSWEARTIDGVIWATLVVIYVVLGVYSLPGFKHHHHHHNLDFVLFPSSKIWLGGLLAIVVVAIFVLILERYLEGRRLILGDELDADRLQNVLTNFGGNANSQLAFLGDKYLFYYQNAAGEDTVVLQYRPRNNKLIVMGDPFGKSDDMEAAIEKFIHDSDQLGYTPVFYEVSENVAMYVHEYGYNFIKMGEEAHVDLPDFSLVGKRHKAERTIINRFERDEHHFEVVEPPFSTEFINQLQVVSDEWLHSRKEKGFSLGFFDESYLQRAPIAVVSDGAGEVYAFTNFMPTNNRVETSIDLMRFRDDAPTGVMDFLFVKLFEYSNAAGYQDFNLGMAPLANVGMYYRSFTEERVANLVYQFGSNFYSFQGLRDFKSKYADDWRPRYTSYAKSSNILFVMIALLIVDNQTIQPHTLKKLRSRDK
ncbi:bifunctional lysylphosphatidylglycerol flippase/synthetase MprF [Periweissella cryptocerci]|uniref:Bifunctional lysylphosphatidylglycerol flippase/synthetase MprF n=1 Tax=Periweissella cryptocerci TaxID=2506420 RepID=A0A4V1AIF5_9LACO|nr:bifunctional lysylphosphatidylglycerol flippase/synthetase MprF [Periweissella cryptocerci]QBO35325.1 bifunctional lysylphosphatidylglycerol flippase/synthetase MprF [Periweissella cryptocerci]